MNILFAFSSTSSLLIFLFVDIFALGLQEFLKTTVLLELFELLFVLFILYVAFLLISWLQTFLNTILIFGFELRKSLVLLNLRLHFLVDQFFFCNEISDVFELLLIAGLFGPLPKHLQVFNLVLLMLLNELVIFHHMLVYLCLVFARAFKSRIARFRFL